MPVLQINFYASLRKITQEKTIGFSLPQDTTVNDLLQAVIDRYPQMQNKLLDENGDLDSHAHIFVNGRNCPLLSQGMETTLAADNKIDIFPIGHF